MREYLLVCVVAATITFLATPAVRWLAVRFGAVTPVRGRDVHSIPVPRLGGVAMLIGFGGSALVASQLPYLSQLFNTPELVGVLIGALIITGLGAIDDFIELDAVTKFAGQMIAAGVMAFAGVQLATVPYGGAITYLPQAILVPLTIFVVIATTNAVNFADGLDGLAAGMVAIAAAAFFVWVYTASPPNFDPPTVFSTPAFILAALVGCCAGFLPHNFHPAKLFMGDAGALLLGLLLAAATISFTGNFDPSNTPQRSSALVAFWLPIALPLSILAVPILDVILAIRRRGLKFWKPDAKHLHHKMLGIGHPHRQAVLLFYAWSAVVAGGVLLFAFVQAEYAAAAMATGMLICLVLTLGLPKLGRKKTL
ncbi:undecaprenyl/decaprenyl-phosphate alpha-N-acetylglucosaminyl 1-phosphate transferase [Yimella sp. cx-573]|nr:undecaprenyl/decaprenyl-phosphate alpha-N-acetylglucosaminyl 1-phosphate transferase [Yimella sp. cx-573]